MSTQSCLGNTEPGSETKTFKANARPGDKLRAWCITNFNDPLQYPDNCRYNLICSDTTKEGKLHYHQYLYFDNQRAFSSIKKLYPTAHLQREIRPQAYIQYIKNNKNGRKTVIFEEGEPPAKNRFPTIAQVKAMTREEREKLPLQYANTIAKMNAAEDNDIDVDEWGKQVKVTWIVGPSGIGKTEKCKALVREWAKEHGSKKINTLKFNGSFWLGVGHPEIATAVYDDFRDSDMKPQEFINFVDYNTHPMNIKNGEIRNTYTHIIITSVQHPKYLWPGAREVEEPRKQWLRRMEIIDMTPDEVESDIDIDDY